MASHYGLVAMGSSHVTNMKFTRGKLVLLTINARAVGPKWELNAFCAKGGCFSAWGCRVCS
jgi:hypothetical protein